MPFIKPENALKRAEEFIDVGKKQRALDTLYEVIRSKKHRTWQIIHEPIMKNYLALCVELKESHMAKDGLHQYKTICQTVNVKSLEDVIGGYLQLAEEKAEKAKKDASDANLIDVDDLENLNSPESLLLRAVSGESSQDRADRDLLAPWLKFVWESYKQCLDLLKNNNKVESVYQQVAKKAFAFCVKYQRKTEFRKLCETIRQHMVQSQKYANQQSSIDLNKPETQNNHLETRLYQLNHAISMELWQEAYKAVEDIYGLMNLSRQKPKPGQMFNYYSKLSLVFWKAGNHLFHAATLQKLFILLKEQKKAITNDELTKISTRLLLATLAIPISPSRSTIDECLEQDDITQEKLKRLSSLLNLQQAPTRLSLVKDLTKYNVVAHVYPEVKDLFKWIEIEFHPLKLSEKVTKCLECNELTANDMYLQYIPAIKEICVTRLLKQVSQIYTNIELERFVQLAPKKMDIFQLEKLIVDSAKQLDLQVRINHQTKSLHFGNDLYVAQKDDLPEGPNIQSMPSEQIRMQLIMISDSLQHAQEMIYGDVNKLRRDELSTTIANIYRQTCEKHHYDLLRRRQLIEEQKEMYERLVSEREQAEAERQKIEKDRLIQPKINNPHFYGKDSFYKTNDANRQEIDEDRERMEMEDIELRKQIEQANREKKELAERLKKEEKKFDHFIRACHEVEIPFINKLAEEDSIQRKKFWEEKEIERIENLKKEQQIQAENKERLLRMLNDKKELEKIVHNARKEEFEKKKADFSLKLNHAREIKLLERKEKRKIDRKNAFYKEIEDKKRKEEDEKRAKEEEDKKRKQDEQAEKQRQREREIEEKLNREKQKVMDSAHQQQSNNPSSSSNVYKPRSAGGTGLISSKQHLEQSSDLDSSWRRSDTNSEQPKPYRLRNEETKENREREKTTGSTDEWRSTRSIDNRDRDRDRGLNQASSTSARNFASKADTADNWRRKEDSSKEEFSSDYSQKQSSTRVYNKDEKLFNNRPNNAQQKTYHKDEGWTEVKGKK